MLDSAVTFAQGPFLKAVSNLAVFFRGAAAMLSVYYLDTQNLLGASLRHMQVANLLRSADWCSKCSNDGVLEVLLLAMAALFIRLTCYPFTARKAGGT